MRQSPRLSDDQLNRLAADIEQRPEVASLIGYPVVAAAFLDLRDARRAALASPTPSLAAAPDLDREVLRKAVVRLQEEALTKRNNAYTDTSEASWNGEIDMAEKVLDLIDNLLPPAAPLEGKEKGSGGLEQALEIAIYLLDLATPDKMGGTPDLFQPEDEAEGIRGWDDWEERAKEAIGIAQAFLPAPGEKGKEEGK